jgi:hypothetical protein
MYPWIVLLHVLGGFGFVLAHGTSAAVALALRRERNLERIRALLELSRSTQSAMYVSLLLLLIAGVIAGFVGQWWGSGWIWTALGLLIVLLVVMFAMGTRYYAGVRKAAGLEYVDRGKPQPPEPPVSPAEMDALLQSSPAIVLAASGIGGLALILWLMLLKPF